MIQRILKLKNRLVIIADYRENNTPVTDYLKKFGALVKLLSLEVGDYIVSDRTVVERKSHEDFINSIIDGRLFKQAEELKDNFSKPIFLVEGDYFRGRINENAVKSAIASIILDYEIPIVMTKTEEETARTIFWLAKREQFITKKGMGIRGKKKPKRMKELQEHVVSSLPGISTVMSRRILEKFRTIRDFVNATENEMKKVEGIGKVLAKRLHKIFNEEYGGNV
jgi:Fanconi anemia group M protein